MSNCCTPVPPVCLECPIIVSCDATIILKPGQIRYCPNNEKYYYGNCNKCLNPDWGAGLQLNANCTVQVKIKNGGGLTFSESGELMVCCSDIISNCGLVTQSQISVMLNQLYTYLESIRPKTCAGTLVTGTTTLATCEDLTTAVAGVKQSKVQVGEITESMSMCVGLNVSTLAGVYSGAQWFLWQARNKSYLHGGGSSGDPAGQYLTKTIKNKLTKPALLEVFLRPICNFVNTYNRSSTSSGTFIHHIGTSLAVAPVGFGQNNTQVLKDWTYTQINFAVNASPYLNDTDYDGWAYAQANGAPAIYQKILAPNETVTLYGQWWFAGNGTGIYSLHGGAKLDFKLTENAEAYV